MPDCYVVAGNPVEHSRSPDIHALFAAQTRQDMQYGRLLAPIGGFEAAVRQFVAKGGKGMNVTVPFKLDAFRLATVLTPRARAAGAVNTLMFEKGAAFGDNTDGKGLMTDIMVNAGCAIGDARVLLLGAGGAARGVVLPLLEQKPAQLVIANRNVDKARELAAYFSTAGKVVASSFDALEGAFDIVINATSAGLSGGMPAVPAGIFARYALALDMVYSDSLTPFLCFAQEHGARVRDGFGMLVEQAAESFFVWRGVRPDTGPVFSMLRPPLP